VLHTARCSTIWSTPVAAQCVFTPAKIALNVSDHCGSTDSSGIAPPQQQHPAANATIKSTARLTIIHTSCDNWTRISLRRFFAHHDSLPIIGALCKLPVPTGEDEVIRACEDPPQFHPLETRHRRHAGWHCEYVNVQKPAFEITGLVASRVCDSPQAPGRWECRFPPVLLLFHDPAYRHEQILRAMEILLHSGRPRSEALDRLFVAAL
jgi:hypothetical protein